MSHFVEFTFRGRRIMARADRIDIVCEIIGEKEATISVGGETYTVDGSYIEVCRRLKSPPKPPSRYVLREEKEEQYDR